MTIRVTVSLPDELVARARRAVAAGEAASLSGYVAAALTARTEPSGIQAYLDALDARFGSIDRKQAAVLDAEIEAAFAGKPRRSRRSA